MQTASMDLLEYLADSAAVLDRTRSAIHPDIMAAAIDTAVVALAGGKPLLICGNGGSAADAEHVTGELVGRFFENRRALKVICLTSNAAVITALGNDQGFDTIFARQVEAYGEQGAVLLGISTSGNSSNVIAAFERARGMEMRTIALTGEGGGRLAPLADYLLAVPSRHTPLVQQGHLCLYHYFCLQVERRMMQSFAAGAASAP